MSNRPLRSVAKVHYPSLHSKGMNNGPAGGVDQLSKGVEVLPPLGKTDAHLDAYLTADEQALMARVAAHAVSAQGTSNAAKGDIPTFDSLDDALCLSATSEEFGVSEPSGGETDAEILELKKQIEQATLVKKQKRGRNKRPKSVPRWLS